MESVNNDGANEYAQVCDKLIDILSASKNMSQTKTNKNPQSEVVGGIIVELLRYLERLEQNERGREIAKKRQADGIAAARARGVKYGRPVTETPDNFGEVVRRWENGELDIDEVLRRTGLKRTTFFNRLREYRDPNR